MSFSSATDNSTYFRNLFILELYMYLVTNVHCVSVIA